MLANDIKKKKTKLVYINSDIILFAGTIRSVYMGWDTDLFNWIRSVNGIFDFRWDEEFGDFSLVLRLHK